MAMAMTEKAQPHQSGGVPVGNTVLRRSCGIFVRILLRGDDVVYDGYETYSCEKCEYGVQQPHPVPEVRTETCAGLGEQLREGYEQHYSG